MILTLKPYDKDNVVLCDANGDAFAMTHIDLFWSNPKNPLYSRLAKGEEVRINIEPEESHLKPLGCVEAER